MEWEIGKINGNLRECKVQNAKCKMQNEDKREFTCAKQTNFKGSHPGGAGAVRRLRGQEMYFKKPSPPRSSAPLPE